MKNTQILFALAALAACQQSAPLGLAPTPEGDGPTIVFDFAARPLPEIPFPNDLASRPDPESPTGRRVNASMVAPTRLEREVRREADNLDGWGTYAPGWVKFDRDIDAMELHRLHGDNDISNDGVFIVRLHGATAGSPASDARTGELTAVDMGRGNFQYGLQKSDNYFPNDPRGCSSNLLWETADETETGETDFDEQIDTPNFIKGPGVNCKRRASDNHLEDLDIDTLRHEYDDLYTWWEKQTHTLLIRPVVPLDQQTTYAVVVTSRVRDPQGRAVRSPFPYVNHAAQTTDLLPLLDRVKGGKVGGLPFTLGEIAFAWTFTTQSVTRELETIRAGLYGEGSLKWLGERFPGKLDQVLPGLDDVQPDNSVPSNVFKVPVAKILELFEDSVIKKEICGSNPLECNALIETFRYADYFVIGQFTTPCFLCQNPYPRTCNAGETEAAGCCDPAKNSCDVIQQTIDGVFKDDWVRGNPARTRVWPEKVYFWAVIPKADDRREFFKRAPFPVAFYGHGYTSARPEGVLGFGGSLAKYGIATVGIDAFGHGLGLDETFVVVLKGLLETKGMKKAAEAIVDLGRARDLNADGIVDSGGDFWTADTFHTRDVVRQSNIDWMQTIRVLRSFDGAAKMQDMNDDGTPELAGDFDADGTVDIGGPDNPYFAWGESLGGIWAAIIPAIEPFIVAAAPTSGGGGLADVGIRSTQGGVVQAVFLEIMGPVIMNCRFDDTRRPSNHTEACAREGATDRPMALVQTVQEVNKEGHVPILISPPIAEGDKVVVTRIPRGETATSPHVRVRWAIAGPSGAIRIPIPADAAVLDYKQCTPAQVTNGECAWKPITGEALNGTSMELEGDPLTIDVYSPEGERKAHIDKFMAWEKDPIGGGKVAPRFLGREFTPGETTLVSLARGFGMRRQHPDFRRFMGLAQMILEPGDPINYAPHYFKDPLPMRQVNDPAHGKLAQPAHVMVVATVGDMNVPVNTGISIARAAGILDYRKEDPRWGMTPNDVLVKSYGYEGLEKLRRFDYDPAPFTQKFPFLTYCTERTNIDGVASNTARQNCADEMLADPDNYAEGQDEWGAPRVTPPLRAEVVSNSALDPGISLLSMPYLDKDGKHGFGTPSNATRRFDMDTYMINKVGRYFQTRGREVVHNLCLEDNSCSFIPPSTP